MLLFAALWNAILIFMVSQVVTMEVPGWGRVALALFATPFVIAGLAFAGMGIYFLRLHRTTLHSPTQGIMWQQDNVGSVKQGPTEADRVVYREEVLTLAGSPPWQASYPASIAELVTWTSKASEKPKEKDLAPKLVSAALLGLLSQGMLKVHRVRIATTVPSSDRGDGYLGLLRDIWHPTQNHVAYVIAAGDAEGDTTVDGSLEGRILGLVRNWSTSSPARDWLFPPTIYLLVLAVFGEDRSDPDEWLVDLVREDAVARHVRLYFTNYDSIREDGINRTWGAWLARQYPEFGSALEKEIRSAIRSRETSGD
jgi:hypothetical protein